MGAELSAKYNVSLMVKFCIYILPIDCYNFSDGIYFSRRSFKKMAVERKEREELLCPGQGRGGCSGGEDVENTVLPKVNLDFFRKAYKVV